MKTILEPLKKLKHENGTVLEKNDKKNNDTSQLTKKIDEVNISEVTQANDSFNCIEDIPSPTKNAELLNLDDSETF